MAKKFLEVFSRYACGGEKAAILNQAFDEKYRYTKEEPVRFECELSFCSHVDPFILYEIEEECRALYRAGSFKILPHFSPSLFSMERISEVVAEASLCGAVTHGFFNGAKYADNGEIITVSIPFNQGGVDFVKRSNAESILGNILLSRYGVKREFLIIEGDGAEEAMKKWEERRERIIDEAERESIEETARKNEERKAQMLQLDPTLGFDFKIGVNDATGNDELLSTHVAKMGATVYDFSESNLIWGDDFDVIEPTPLSKSHGFSGTTVFLGTVFELVAKDTRQGDKKNVTIGISDGACAIYVKRAIPIAEAGFADTLKLGTHLAVLGRVSIDKFDSEDILIPRGIKKISVKLRTDDAPRKRVELHLHTNMSQMDAISSPADVVKTAIRWGHPAIAITDHGNVQSFPEAMLALEKAGEDKLKILYGTEGYFVNDTAKCIFGTKYPEFNGEMVVFDIETTGLSHKTCKIIEIGAVKIKNGEIVDTIDLFVDPEEKIPENITALTGIDDSMVEGAPKEEEAIRTFFDFVGDCMLIAHNATFDVSFIREASRRNDIPFENSYLDTLGLSRYLNRELKNHKLDTLVKHYKIGEFNHHRASDDALVLAKIFL